MGLFSEVVEENQRQKMLTQGRDDAYYGLYSQHPNNNDYMEGYDQVSNDELWRYKPACE